MDEHSLKVTVDTPNGEVFSYETATLVMLHTTGGVVGVMANHSPIVAALQVSEVHIVDDNNNFDEVVAVSGGFAEFSNNTLTVLVESAECVEDIDLNRAEAARERAERHLKNEQESRDKIRAEAALMRAVNRINAVNSESGK
ncbi:F0F1 ATP synthase subunit epsilon [Weissella oryzae SG25]|uniref:ATP synthase epsilon chain n=1 Tax=Weissella oryzae (strain DSM 25784 / JCM 18191 / LMG 30913 / SG25) TaxID=1329250 RepID=A0A069CS21_WEIOS|nr:F0F1 ATP synthase subunit epsilon [Weissella oryzae]GAK30023.1 F0F1 ATP synthase subunit epsilon [Weissella oryzae SG25]